MFAPEEIQELVARIARQVAYRGTDAEKEDFVSDALTYLYEPRENAAIRIMLYDPSKGQLEPWLARLFRNAWVSQQRQKSTQHRADVPLELVEDCRAPILPSWERMIDTFGDPFSTRDLKIVEKWNPRERAELLSLTGIHAKLPSNTWEEFVVACEAEMSQPIDRPFPPIAAHENHQLSPSQRVARIATAMKIPANTLSVRWRRLKHLLKDLELIQNLRGHNPNEEVE